MTLSELVRRVHDSRWDLIGLTVGCLISIASIFFSEEARADGRLIFVTLAFTITFVGFFAYQFMHLKAFSSLTSDRSDLIRQRDDALDELAISEHYHEKADAAFTKLSREQSAFEGTLIGGLMASFKDKSSSPHSHKQARRGLHAFMQDVCDAAVETIASRKMEEASHFQANIKLFYRNNAGELRYETFARSRNTTRDRLNTDAADKPGYIVDNNAFFYTLRRRNNTRRFVVIDDIAAKLDEWQADEGDATREPTISARDFYRSCMCVGIFGKDYTDSELDRAHVKVNQTEILIGAIFIDSKEYTFDKSKDLTIMEELSTHVFSSVRNYDFVMHLLEENER
jgi:hypothetical protein